MQDFFINRLIPHVRLSVRNQFVKIDVTFKPLGILSNKCVLLKNKNGLLARDTTENKDIKGS